MISLAAVVRAALLGTLLLGLAFRANARCTCSDVRPRFTHDGPPVPFGCEEQRRFGKCDEPFMLDTIEELPEGYCQISCGRCDCCSTFEDLALNLGLDEMLEMMKLGGLDPVVMQANPAWMASVLVPQPGSFSKWLSVQGWTKESVSTTTAQRTILKDTLMLHILPPVEPIIALWTTPFFLTGTTIPTSSKAFPPVSGFRDSTSVGVTGGLNSVTVINGNQEFCKGYIHVVNDVLLAFPLQVAPIVPSGGNGTSVSNNLTNSPVKPSTPSNQTEGISPNTQTVPPAVPTEAPTASNQPGISPSEASATSGQSESTNSETPAETISTGNQTVIVDPEGSMEESSPGKQSESITPVATSPASSEADKPQNPEEAPASVTVSDGASDNANSGSSSNFLG